MKSPVALHVITSLSYWHLGSRHSTTHTDSDTFAFLALSIERDVRWRPELGPYEARIDGLMHFVHTLLA